MTPGARARLLVGLCAGLLPGCAALPEGQPHWGSEATASPGWGRVGASARAAAADPRVWLPLLGAAALQVDDWDARASDWAREHTPVFGSTGNARRRSDDLRDAADYAWYAAALAARSGDAPGAWLANKGRGLLVDAAAVTLSGATTAALKSGTDRLRPDGSDRRSFPSGHASGAAVRAALASRHLEHAPLAPAARPALDLGLDAVAAGTAWARVEAGVHYPADALFGMALGRFVGLWLNDAFLDPRRPGRRWTVLIYPRADAAPSSRGLFRLQGGT